MIDRPFPVLWRAASAALFCCALLIAGGAAAQPIGQPEAPTGTTEKRGLTVRKHLVVAANPHASDAGLEILRAGGSAVDSAIAVQLVLGLVEPQSSGLGGGGFLLHWSAADGRLRSYDGRETAPLATGPQRFIDAEHRPLPFFDAVTSGLSVGVPGLVRLLELAHRRHGRLPWRRLFEPAIRLAERGFALSPRLHGLVARDRYLSANPAARALYYGSDGAVLPVGTPIRNPEYARTLRAIAAEGALAFYFGAIAEDIVLAVRGHRVPGDLTLVDLARYRAVERAPVCGPYRSWRICGLPPPSAGGVLIVQLLGILERTGFERAAPNSAIAVHLFSEAARLAYADRNHFIGDPDFVAVPVAGLIDAAYLDERAALVDAQSMQAAEPGRPKGAPERSALLDYPSTGTTHLSIVDAHGNAVAMTASVENAFGSRIMVRGFLLNNQLTDFSFDPRSRGAPAANRVEPGKRPRSTMSPTMVFDAAGKLYLVAGSPGGAMIGNFVAKTLVGVLDWKVDLQSAIELPNFGSTNGPTRIERGTLYEELNDALAARGHVINFSLMTSGVHAIQRLPSARWRGGADPRREGVARGD